MFGERQGGGRIKSYSIGAGRFSGPLLRGCAWSVITLFCIACAEPKYLKIQRLDPPRNSQTLEKPLSDLSFSGLKIWFKWEVLPTHERFGSFILKFGRANSLDESPMYEDIQGELFIELWMPSMGHGSSPVKVERLDRGSFRVSEVFFSMPGEWEIRLRRVESGVVLEKASIPFLF